MKEFSRVDRIADHIQRELAQMIQLEMRDPRIGMVTISDVRVSRDLSVAKIYVSMFEAEKVNTTIETLNKAKGFLRSLLSKKMTSRITPVLHFYYDDLLEKGNRIEKLLAESRVDEPDLTS